MFTYNRSHHVKKINKNNTFLLLVGVWPKKQWFQYIGAFSLCTWPCLLPIPKQSPWDNYKFWLRVCQKSTKNSNSNLFILGFIKMKGSWCRCCFHFQMKHFAWSLCGTCICRHDIHKFLWIMVSHMRDMHCHTSWRKSPSPFKSLPATFH